ncbi:DUF2809 domain-containing protein [Clostridium cellulovorans]|uniref:DUF2809 domain-containing protein n=1 Tax=Clostridium cellulovorans (strain ATCC 35296 / DSM 3052 / OCM 3 / 743B) TaxID=573061 RepID=D9SN53_CLOC7|nr:DUF2809 domain-containing protein [Clostridium cellulovorans]ADL51919.1 Protein of unknown function DUF2809 [Clostridium cellulovorans 743B]
MIYKRNRYIYFIFLVSIIALGLFTRKFPELFPNILNIYLGDALWALMIFIGLGFLFPSKNMWIIAIFAILFCYGIELSQLYQGVFIDSIRKTSIGRLVLGVGFLWSDLIAYILGISLGFLLESIFFIVLRKSKKINRF